MSKPLMFAFSVFGNRYYFTPKFIMPSAIIILLFISLGFWQLNRAQKTANLLQMISFRITLEPIQYTDLQKEQDFRFYPIQTEGTFDNDHQILLAHRTYKGQTGYEVLTPLKPSADSASAILVDRGWVAANTDPANLAINPVTGVVAMSGLLVEPSVSSSLLSINPNPTNIQWPLVVNRIDIEQLTSALGYPLNRYIMLLSPKSNYGFTREWLRFTTALNPNQHKHYALEFFIITLIVLIAFFVLNIQRG